MRFVPDHVIVLGGGVGGIPVANRLVRARDDIRVTLIDSHGDHVYQAGSINVALGTVLQTIYACW